MTEDKKPEIVLVGDYNWNICRLFLINKLLKINTEKEFLEMVWGISKSIGTKKELEKTREEMGIHPHTKEDKEKMSEKKKHGKQKL